VDSGIGLPNAVAGTTGDELTGWARAAEERGFSTLGTIDRVVYPSYEPLIALAAAAAATERIRLATSILIAPLRSNVALFAKQAASVQALSGGRLTLGLAVGPREDDFEVSGLEFSKRGEVFDSQLAELKRVWAGEVTGMAGAVGPEVDPPELVIGGQIGAAFRRVAEHGSGWIMGGGAPDQLAEGVAAAKKAWSDAGREGEPRIMSLAYFSLGPRAEEDAKHDLEHYYAWLGEETAQMISGSAAKDPDTVQAYASGFEQAGCDELIWFPASSDPEQVGLLADALGL
jgi:alkanesulfonate monooxygenase SsuD/methylene tetrahydromethanopterin reductase-like flavin-dependent oxidoreductase (luciferase family)